MNHKKELLRGLWVNPTEPSSPSTRNISEHKRGLTMMSDVSPRYTGTGRFSLGAC